MSFSKHLFKTSILASIISIVLASSGFPQNTKECPDKAPSKKKPRESSSTYAPVVYPVGLKSMARIALGDAEKSIKTNEKVYLSFCVTGASVKVNGWDRSEIRAFVRGGSDIVFKVRERSAKDRLPLWVDLIAGEADETNQTLDSCISGKSLELDVPFQSSVTISGKSGDTSVSVDSISTAKIKISSGDISLVNVSRGVKAHTDVGGVSVSNSVGKMEMTTTAGNIVAFETESEEIGDYFKAKTISGAITLQSVKQKEVEATSLSGSINFLGTPYAAGNYSFSTTNGYISLAVPSDSAFKLKAAYGGAFTSELALENVYKKASNSTVFLTGFVGKESGAAVSVRSFSGTIRIRRLDQTPTP